MRSRLSILLFVVALAAPPILAADKPASTLSGQWQQCVGKTGTLGEFQGHMAFRLVKNAMAGFQVTRVGQDFVIFGSITAPTEERSYRMIPIAMLELQQTPESH